MHRTLPGLVLAVAIAFSGSGCATTAGKAADDQDAQKLVEDAPLGSRIRKKSNIAPVAGATREDIERARVQQNAIESGVANNPAKAMRTLR